ncbi:MAG: microcin C ABC transporter permease YejB [Alphaproteobacteria bacterium]|nr:microcin C ABC transporter permease YejB [Alphaproteobacteria bacterium]MCB9930505.1 microcin C ABC transporter permease YejB [Alphaproteobacteria bacterium]
MLAYIIRRLLLMIPTLLGIMAINFLIIQLAPGGPVEQVIAQLSGQGTGAIQRVTQSGSEFVPGAGGEGGPQGGASTSPGNTYRGAQGLDPEFIKDLERQFGFDKPLGERFLMMMGSYLTFDFGKSFFRDQSVVDLVLEKMPVSISLGLWTTLLTYLICLPLGIAKAVRDGSRFDVWTSGLIIVGNAIPSFGFAILLLVLFAGGNYFDWFPLRGLTSPGFDQMSLLEQIGDYFWHMTLPLAAMMIGAFATLTLLTKNSFLDQISQQYVITARAKGLTERQVLWGHVFRNGMLIVIAGFPGAFVGILFGSAVFIETIFSLDGLGLLGLESALNRDYPVMFATLYVFTLLGLVMGLVGDLMYMIVDPRIDFEARGA